MKKFSSLFFLLIPQISHCFMPFNIQNDIFHIKDIEKIDKICGNNDCNGPNSFLEYHDIKNIHYKVNSDELADTKFQILDFFHILDNKQNGVNIVKSISSLLPHVDSIGHKVLHANNEFINSVLLMDTLSDDLKKSIILFSIKMAQYGDDMGSELLQIYYDLVDKCL